MKSLRIVRYHHLQSTKFMYPMVSKEENHVVEPKYKIEGSKKTHLKLLNRKSQILESSLLHSLHMHRQTHKRHCLPSSTVSPLLTAPHQESKNYKPNNKHQRPKLASNQTAQKEGDQLMPYHSCKGNTRGEFSWFDQWEGGFWHGTKGVSFVILATDADRYKRITAPYWLRNPHFGEVGFSVSSNLFSQQPNKIK